MYTTLKVQLKNPPESQIITQDFKSILDFHIHLITFLQNRIIISNCVIVPEPHPLYPDSNQEMIYIVYHTAHEDHELEHAKDNTTPVFYTPYAQNEPPLIISESCIIVPLDPDTPPYYTKKINSFEPLLKHSFILPYKKACEKYTQYLKEVGSNPESFISQIFGS